MNEQSEPFELQPEVMPDPFGPSDTQRSRYGYPLVAWTLIIATMLFVILGRDLSGRHEEMKEEAMAPLVEFSMKYSIGSSPLLPGQNQLNYNQSSQLNAGPVKQRLSFAIFAGEMVGADEALNKLAEIQGKLDDGTLSAEPKDRELIASLERLFGDYSEDDFQGPSVSTQEREALVRELGWLGELALVPSEGDDEVARKEVMTDAQSAVIVAFTGLGVVLLFGAIGLAVLVIGLILVLLKKLRSTFGTRIQYGGLYAETFAIWMILYLVLGFGLVMLMPDTPIVAQIIGGFASLVAVLWPVVRGVPWTIVREDIGLTTRFGIVRDVLSGIGVYFATLPILGAGLFVTFLLVIISQAIAGPDALPPNPSHPITAEIAEGGVWSLIAIFVVAAVAAPIIEETMFRGFLYRHLRESTGSGHIILSIMLSMFITSFVFAAIHPQGWFGVPPLMCIAIGFTIGRETFGSLIPCMVAHGVHNGLTLAATLVLLS